jgi:hypothetical protein
MIKLHLTQIDALEMAVATIEARMDNALGLFRATGSLLTTMPGLSETSARVLIDLRARFLHIKGRRGAKKAILAVASSMLTAAYFMLRDRVEHHDLGNQYFDQRDKAQPAKRLLQRLRDLGVAVAA